MDFRTYDQKLRKEEGVEITLVNFVKCIIFVLLYPAVLQ
jgi:hypothetical protein